MDWECAFNSIIAALGTAAVYLFGGWDMMLQVLLIFIAFDLLTGVMAAFKKKDVSSDVYLYGVIRKVGILILVSIGHLLDIVIEFDDPMVRTAVIFWLIAREGISILENLSVVGVKIPEILKEALRILKKEHEQWEGDN